MIKETAIRQARRPPTSKPAHNPFNLCATTGGSESCGTNDGNRSALREYDFLRLLDCRFLTQVEYIQTQLLLLFSHREMEQLVDHLSQHICDRESEDPDRRYGYELRAKKVQISMNETICSLRVDCFAGENAGGDRPPGSSDTVASTNIKRILNTHPAGKLDLPVRYY